ncbi:hypothetical protein GW17_00055748 [Ensete ventricosum]|nr:hypothetical protein GW17_00055748 [Ensete ventricosum]
MVSHTSMVSRKNTTVINFARSRVSIGISCTISEIQNTGLSRLIRPREVVQARFPDVLAHGKLYQYDFMKKHDNHKICTK